MSFMGIGGGFNPLQMVSQIAMAAATGGTSLIAQMAIKLATEIASQVIQQLGDQLGLPQPMIDAAQGALRGATGDFAGAAAEYSQAAGGAAGGLEQMVSGFAQHTGGTQRDAAAATDDLNQQIGNFVAQGAQSEEFKTAKSGGTRGGGSWLMALAEAMGKMLDAKAAEIEGLAETMTDKTPSATAKFGAANQEFGLMMNATNNALKTIGEALSTMARKG